MLLTGSVPAMIHLPSHSFSATIKPMRNEATKNQLIEGLKECMRHKQLEDITVREISDAAGVSRQTFYRSFLDKYDLANQYFDQLLALSFDQMGSGKTLHEGLVKKFRYIRQEQIFFTNAFRTDTQNNLKNHDFERITAFYCNLIREKTGHDPDSEIRELLEMYCQASVYKTSQWALSGMKTSPEELADLMIDAMPPKLYRLFTKLHVFE